MILEIPRENIDTLLDHGTTSSSAQLREQVIQTWNVQQNRFKDSDLKVNAQISSQNIDTYIPLSSSVKEFVKQASMSLNLSPRVVHRTLKLARTIADLEQSEDVQTHHVAESLQYRNKNMFIEN
jgi:magnesium chelatase family protein